MTCEYLRSDFLLLNESHSCIENFERCWGTARIELKGVRVIIKMR